MKKEKAFFLVVAGEAREKPSAGRIISGCEGRGVDLLLSRRIRVSRELARAFFPDGSMDTFVGQDAIGIILEGVGAFQKVCSIAEGGSGQPFRFYASGQILTSRWAGGCRKDGRSFL